MGDEAAEYWSAFEKETGEKIEARCEGNWLHVPNSGAVHEGLLVLTDKSLRFKYVTDTLRPYMTTVAPEFEDRSEFTIARDDIVSVRVPKRGFFARLFGRAFPRYSVVARSESGEKTYVFSADPSSTFITALTKTWPEGTSIH
jgi:hypothetical protein